MTDPRTPSSPSSDQPSAPDREDPNCQPIVAQSMVAGSEDAQPIGGEQWTEIVLQSLSGRSPQAREALLKALQNDQPARWTESSSGMDQDWGIGEPKVCGDAGRNDRTPASVRTSPAKSRVINHGDGSGNIAKSPPTVPPVPPLGSNGSKASNEESLNGQPQVRKGSMPLLGLEPTSTENTRFNPNTDEDSNSLPLLAPLLGTIVSEIVENLGKSSTGRSPKSVCYGKLLREYAPRSPEGAQKTVLAEHRGCNGFGGPNGHHHPVWT